MKIKIGQNLNQVQHLLPTTHVTHRVDWLTGDHHVRLNACNNNRRKNEISYNCPSSNTIVALSRSPILSSTWESRFLNHEKSSCSWIPWKVWRIGMLLAIGAAETLFLVPNIRCRNDLVGNNWTSFKRARVERQKRKTTIIRRASEVFYAHTSQETPLSN